MKDLKIFDYNNTAIQFEVIDGQLFANATTMCQAFDKRPNANLRSNEYQVIDAKKCFNCF